MTMQLAKQTRIPVSLVIMVSFAAQAVVAIERPRLKPSTSAEIRWKSWQQHQNFLASSQFGQTKWECVGPRMQGGRIEAIACPPGKPSTMYVGAGSGGLWKTDNHGLTWRPVFEQQATCAIGDVAVAQSDPDTVWLGTGEVLMARSTLPGMGVYRSTDAGATWQSMGLRDTHHIGRIVIDPKNSDVVYVAAIGHMSTPNQQRGVFKTSNGGKSWTKVLYIDDLTSVIDLTLDPSNSSVVYATTWHRNRDGHHHYGKRSGIYKSADGGNSWRRLTNGLPIADDIGRIAVAVARTNPKVVYALFDSNKTDRLFRSDDFGNSWNHVNQDRVKAGWDWCEIMVSPDNENELYNIGQKSFVSKDGGKTFTEIGGTIVHLLHHDSPTLHLDTHSMWIDPANADRVIFGNDGGLYVSFDRCKTWLHANNLPIAECYAVSYDMEKPFNIYIGTQDNAALFGPSDHRPQAGRPDPWKHVYLDRWGGGDSYFTYRDPTDKNTIYYEHQYGDLRRKDMSTGRSRSIRPRMQQSEGRIRTAWMTPYFPSNHNPRRLYYAGNFVFRSEDRGDGWSRISPDLALGDTLPNLRYKAITTLAEQDQRAGVLVAGTDNGHLHLTRDDGKNWSDIAKGLPVASFTRAIFSRHDSATLYTTLSGMLVDDFRPYVYRSDDMGKTWRNIGIGLPVAPVNVIHEDPQFKDILYVGTDMGAYVSVDGGKNWQTIGKGLPTAAVHDLVVHPRDRKLIAATHGRSVYLLDLEELDKANKKATP